MRQWQKLGQIYLHRAIHPKLSSHAANPLAVHIEGDVFRVFYSSRDSRNRSSVGFVDIDIADRRVLYVHDQPVFEHGPPTSFYRDGISIGGTYSVDGQTYMLFMAWQSDAGQHWRGDIGRFLLRDNRELELDPADHPYLGSDEKDPVSLSYPWVIQDGDGYQMWYGSTECWDAGNGEMLHVIKHATSEDGQDWTKHGQAIEHRLGVAQAFSRPTICLDEAGYHMWFSYRGAASKYRIGYAFSTDGLRWDAEFNNPGINVSADSWDSEMIEYPFVFEHKGERYMLYNGNDYGRTGFGLAVQETP